jgi:hypothetical protein
MSLIVRLPRALALHHLVAAPLLAPHMVDLHSSLLLCSQVQVLLGQVGPELSDLKLREGGDRERELVWKRHTHMYSSS